MSKYVRHRVVQAAMVLLLLPQALMPSAIYADEKSMNQSLRDNEDGDSIETEKYYLGHAVNTGQDNGYSDENKIESNDPHYGWILGQFFVDGYTSTTGTDAENPVFLKNVGDTVTLWFQLQQNIDKLNGKDSLSISDDINGYDKNFQIEKQDFGRGTLIISHKNYQNLSEDPEPYVDYLTGISLNAATQVQLFEEGDYEVSLDYEIKNDPRKLNLLFMKMSIIPTYTNYKIFIKFKVRNGNAMFFPFDTKTGEELQNNSVTENGFYIDFAKSRYLDITVKKEVLSNNTLVEDTRFNRPAKDKEQFLEEGIYTISATNKYTTAETTKKICVSTDSVLTNYFLKDTTPASPETAQTANPEPTQTSTPESIQTPVPTATSAPTSQSQNGLTYSVIVFGIIALLVLMVAYLFYRHSTEKLTHANSVTEREDQDNRKDDEK
jgi:hypothetical protein